MTNDEREIRRKLRVLEHAQGSGNIAKTCRYYGVPRSLFYLWRAAYEKHGPEGLKRKKPIPKSHPNQFALDRGWPAGKRPRRFCRDCNVAA